MMWRAGNDDMGKSGHVLRLSRDKAVWLISIVSPELPELKNLSLRVGFADILKKFGGKFFWYFGVEIFRELADIGVL